MTDVLQVACSCDGAARYVAHSAAMLHSALAHRGGLDLHVHYLTGEGFPDGAARPLASMVEAHGASISFVPVPDALVAGLPTTDHLPAASWYRVFLPELLEGLQRVLYLDTDMIVADSLAPLWHADLDGRWLGAVANVFMRDHTGRQEWLGMDEGVAYFNGGVMLVDLEAWRREGATGLMRDAAAAAPEKMGWADQDAMNVVMGAHRLALHPRWNATNSLMSFPWSAELFGVEVVEEARRRPAIRHFEGPSVNKPWHYLCEHEMRELYFEHRRETPWPDVRVEGRTPANVLRRRLRERRARGREMRHVTVPRS